MRQSLVFDLEPPLRTRRVTVAVSEDEVVLEEGDRRLGELAELILPACGMIISVVREIVSL